MKKLLVELSEAIFYHRKASRVLQAMEELQKTYLTKKSFRSQKSLYHKKKTLEDLLSMKELSTIFYLQKSFQESFYYRRPSEGFRYTCKLQEELSIWKRFKVFGSIVTREELQMAFYTQVRFRRLLVFEKGSEGFLSIEQLLKYQKSF